MNDLIENVPKKLQTKTSSIKIVKANLLTNTKANIPCPALVESIIVENKKTFLISYLNNSKLSIITKDKVEVNGKVFDPIQQDELPYQQYQFDKNELKVLYPNTYQLYERVFHEVQYFVDIEDEWKHFITACVLFSYQQDKASTTPYVYVVGDNDSGKSTILHLLRLLGYRPLLSESLPYADIYHFLGTSEDAVGIILEDESQGLEKDWNKLKIYKGGYVKGSRIPRIKETSTGSKQIFYRGYCFKMLAGEALPKDKGLLRRCIIIPMIEGYPSGNIKHLTTDDMNRLSQLRKDLLLWRMNTAHQVLPQIKLDFLINRDEEIWLPLLRVVKDTRFYNNLIFLAQKHVHNRMKEKFDSIEAVLSEIVIESTKKSMQVAFDDIWNKLTKDDGHYDTTNSQVFYSDHYGKITKTLVGSILTQKFRGKKFRDKNKRYYQFDKNSIDKINRKYSMHSMQGLQKVLT